MRGFRGWLVVVAVALAATTPATPAAGDTVSQSASRLPTPRAGTSAVWTGEHVFVFGGATDPPVSAPRGVPVGITADIVRFTPSTGEVRVMGAKLPGPRWATSAVWDGRYAYVFGGCVTRACDDVGQDTDQIVRYDPAADAASVVGRLPSPRHGTAAFWSGDAAFVIGGRYAECQRRFCEGEWEPRHVQRFVPGVLDATPTSTVLTAYFPSVVWTGDTALVTGDSGYVLAYVPATDTLTDTRSRLPDGAFAASAVWDGSHMFVYGGIDGFTRHRDIARYDPSSNLSVAMSSRLPGPHSTGSAVWDGTRAWIVGGVFHNGSDARLTDAIISYDPAPILPTAPRSLAASRGPGRGEITLAWKPPLHADDIESYKVFRDETLVGTSSTTSFRDGGLSDGLTATYHVSAVNGVGEGPRSPAVAQVAPELPGAPTALSASPGPLLGQVTLEWTAPQDGGGVPVGYVVHRDGSTIAAVPGPRYVDANLPPGERVAYRVQATNVVGAGPPGNEASAITPTVPTAVRALVAAAGPGRGEVTLNWSAPSGTWGAPVSYEVFVDGSQFALTGATRSFKHSGLADAETHSYAVRASNSFGPGPLGETVAGHSPRLPVVAGLTAAPGADEGQIRLSWQADSTGGVPVSVYRVFRDGGLAGEVTGAFTTFVDTGLSPASEHTYRVAGINVVGAGSPSEPATSSAQPAPLAGEAAAVVVLSGSAATPSADVTVRNGGTVAFTSLLPSHNPRDAAHEGGSQFCFDYRREHEGRIMGTGTVYRLVFRYEPATEGLAVSTDGGATFKDCPPGTGEATPEGVVVPYRFGTYYSDDRGGSITVRT